MHTVAQLQERINKELKELRLPAEPSELYEPVSYVLSLGGKRMRPLLVLMGCELCGGKMEDALFPALGIEVFHNFTLLHDDIMDHAPLRRSKPTVHERWNIPVAILSGDAMFVKSAQLMMQCDAGKMKQVMELFLDTALQVCEGQQLDMNFESRKDVSIADYLHMITLKTAVLLGTSLKTGALLAGTGTSTADHLYEFGKNIGVAFQLQDDILDVYAEGEKFGKQVGGDIVVNKKTFLLLKALEMAVGKEAAELNQLLAVQQSDVNKKVSGVKAIYEKLGVKALAQKEMERFHGKAMDSLSQVTVTEDRKKPLLDFAENLMVRET